jgi:hypothetical protein
MCPADACQMWICLLWVRLLGDVNLWCNSYVNMWCYINSHTCLTKFLKIIFFYLMFMIYYTSSRVVLYLPTLLVLRPTQPPSPSLLPLSPRAAAATSPLTFVPLTSPHAVMHATPLRRDTRHTTLDASRTTPRSTRRAPHLWQRDLEEEGPSSDGGNDDDD